MDVSYYSSYCQAIGHALGALVVTDETGHPLTAQEGLNRATTWAGEVLVADGWLYFCGNGASAAMASHMSLDWLKNSGVKAACFNDLASLTALGNDNGFKDVFAMPLKRLATPRDILITISSSGNSPNIVAALTQARALGVRTITFSGLQPDNRSRALGDINFYIPCRTYGIAECSHQVLLHAWLDQYMGVAEWKT